MAELADAIDLGSIVKRRAGSSPVIRIRKSLLQPLPQILINGWILMIQRGCRTK